MFLLHLSPPPSLPVGGGKQNPSTLWLIVIYQRESKEKRTFNIHVSIDVNLKMLARLR